MAHKKGVGSSKNGRESESKRLGIKLFGGEFAKAGNIIVRQRGTAHHPGENTGIGKDHTIYALIDGIVVFRKTKNNRSFISVKSLIEEPAKEKTKPQAAKVEVPVEAPVIEEVVTASVAETTATETPAEEKVKKAAAKPKAKKEDAGEAEAKPNTAKPKAAAKPKAKKADDEAETGE